MHAEVTDGDRPGKLIEAAAWVIAKREAQLAEIEGRHKAADVASLCPDCGGPGSACVTCAGTGVIEREAGDDETFPEHLAELEILVQACGMIERYGMDGWRSMTQTAAERAEPLDERFVAAMLVYTGELARLESIESHRRMSRS